jgi:hypothetical protein
MDAVVYGSDAQKVKCKHIVENTIRECNRVLESWAENKNKITTYDDIISLVNSYMTRFIRKEFNIKNGFKVSDYSPLCTIENKKIIKISLSDITRYYRYLPSMTYLAKYLETFDFVSFNKTLELEKFIETNDSKPIESLSDINFDDIRNIKF